MAPRRPKVIQDAAYHGMWRVQWPDGRVSDMANLTRVKDAAACFVETEERRQRGRQSPSEGRLCVKTESASPIAAAAQAMKQRLEMKLRVKGPAPE